MTEFAPGEIVEIKTPEGLAYVQVTHKHASYPQVVRALPGLHHERPADVAALAAGPASFTAMIPLEGALARLGLEAEVAARVDIPEAEFPTFRMPIRDKEGNIVYWWLWDGEGLTYEAELAEGHDRLPMREVMTADRFIARLTERATVA